MIDKSGRRFEMNKKEYEKNPKICDACPNKLTWKQRHGKYCSRSCASRINNQGVRRHGKPERLCHGCGKPTRNPKYCTNQCQKDQEYARARLKAIDQQSMEGIGVALSKKILIDLLGHKCCICKRTKWGGQGIPLVMDHIDGNSDNNSFENLRLVCGNCDMQLPTYKNKNNGNGRHWRKKRYRQGKSY
jgi:uncharacterized CHY-type Zn-finger protein